MSTEQNSYLDARVKLAMAQVLLGVDWRAAAEIAGDGLHDVVLLAAESTLEEIPWPLRGVPCLVAAYREGRSLGDRNRSMQAALEAKRVRAFALAQEERVALAAAVTRAELETPGADELLARLQAGKDVKVNCHSLNWDDDFDGLVGTNSYGQDYYWGEMTLRTVEGWRSRMIAGEELGCSPENTWSGDGWEVEGWTEDLGDADDFDPAVAAGAAYRVFANDPRVIASRRVFEMELDAIQPTDGNLE